MRNTSSGLLPCLFSLLFFPFLCSARV
jgi:hypothetical protein